MKLVDTIQERFTARLVYGDVVERDGVIVLPVIRVMGGGGGGSDPEDGEGRIAYFVAMWLIRRSNGTG